MRCADETIQKQYESLCSLPARVAKSSRRNGKKRERGRVRCRRLGIIPRIMGSQICTATLPACLVLCSAPIARNYPTRVLNRNLVDIVSGHASSATVKARGRGSPGWEKTPILREDSNALYSTTTTVGQQFCTTRTQLHSNPCSSSRFRFALFPFSSQHT